jgi:hypothetical protein
VKGVETWVYGCDTEMTRQSSQRITEFSSDTPSLLKHLGDFDHFFGYMGVVHREFVPKGDKS